MVKKNSADEYSEKEAKARFESALKGAMSAPHKPLKEKPKLRTSSPLRTPAKKAARKPR
jgi:hypothetical protein